MRGVQKAIKDLNSMVASRDYHQVQTIGRFRPLGSSGHFGRLIPLEGSDHWEVEGSNHWEVHTIGKFIPLGSSDHWEVQTIGMFRSLRWSDYWDTLAGTFVLPCRTDAVILFSVQVYFKYSDAGKFNSLGARSVTNEYIGFELQECYKFFPASRLDKLHM